jgi:methyltransferase (TIGR00027 family)
MVIDAAGRGIDQYVILGAGLDTFAQRRPEVASRFHIFEVDRPGPQAWKRQRLIDLGFGMPDWLRFISVDFETGEKWWQKLASAGFDLYRPAIIASTGVSMYLTPDAIAATLRQIAIFAPGSTLAISFLMPIESAEPELRPALEFALKGSRASGTPLVSFFTPDEMIRMALDAGFKEARHVSAESLGERYFSGRTDGLRPPKNAEELLIATT